MSFTEMTVEATSHGEWHAASGCCDFSSHDRPRDEVNQLGAIQCAKSYTAIGTNGLDRLPASDG